MVSAKILITDYGLSLQLQFDRKSLVRVLRVSKHLFALGSAELYCHLVFWFSSDALSNESSNSTVTAALHTIVTSEYDYAQHIRSFHLGMLQDHPHINWVFVNHLWNSSPPNQALNTLLLLLLRKVKSLETFSWDVPVNLSVDVYQALHVISPLQRLKIRLDAVNSSWIRQSHASALSAGIPTTITSQLNSVTNGSGAAVFPSSLSIGAALKFKTKNQEALLRRPLFSGFKSLTSLSLVKINSLDCLEEVADCLRASSLSIRTLKISLVSDFDLVCASNEPADNPTDTEDDDEDEADADPLAPPTAPPSTGTQPVMTEAEKRTLLVAKDNILARILDLQTVSKEGKRNDKEVKKWIKDKASRESRLKESIQKLLSRGEKMSKEEFAEVLRRTADDLVPLSSEPGTEHLFQAKSGRTGALSAPATPAIGENILHCATQPPALNISSSNAGIASPSSSSLGASNATFVAQAGEIDILHVSEPSNAFVSVSSAVPPTQMTDPTEALIDSLYPEESFGKLHSSCPLFTIIVGHFLHVLCVLKG